MLTRSDIAELHMPNTIMLGYRGSIAHGMYTPGTIDDIDVIGVYVGSPEMYIGLKTKPKAKQVMFDDGRIDVVYYELTHFVNLLLKSNPNVLCTLWMPADCRIEVNRFGASLINNASLFSSKKAFQAFIGYANGQLSRMSKVQGNGYMGAKRKELFEKFGYDPKNAAHAVRLLLMGIEFLRTGRLRVRRADADMLLEIKNGGWVLDEILDFTNALFSDARLALRGSPLPEEPAYKLAEKLTMSIIREYL